VRARVLQSGTGVRDLGWVAEPVACSRFKFENPTGTVGEHTANELFIRLTGSHY